MLVSKWAQNYWAVSTVAKKTLYDYKNVFGRVVEPFIGSKDLDEVSLMDIQKLVLATTPYQARLALMITKTLYREAQLYGMTEKNTVISVKLHVKRAPGNIDTLCLKRTPKSDSQAEATGFNGSQPQNNITFEDSTYLMI
jgi:hypothetical protein